MEDSSASAAALQLPPLILVTTVDIGEGKNGQIELRQGDDPMVMPHRLLLLSQDVVLGAGWILVYSKPVFPTKPAVNTDIDMALEIYPVG
jgi:hypothetical protein